MVVLHKEIFLKFFIPKFIRFMKSVVLFFSSYVLLTKLFSGPAFMKNLEGKPKASLQEIFFPKFSW